jgi:hypothetical protein
MKLVMLIKMCLNETYSKVHIDKYLSDTFPIQNCLKQGDNLSPLLFNFTLEYAIRKGQENHLVRKLDKTHQLLVYADDVNLLEDNINIYLFYFRNFPCIHSFPQPKDIIVTSGLLAFTCFCDEWGTGRPHQPPTWGTRIFCQGYLP